MAPTLNRTAAAVALSVLAHVVVVAVVLKRSSVMASVTPEVAQKSQAHSATVRVSVMGRHQENVAALPVEVRAPAVSAKKAPTLHDPEALPVTPDAELLKAIGEVGVAQAVPSGVRGADLSAVAGSPESSPGSSVELTGQPVAPAEEPRGPSATVQQAVHTKLQNAANSCYPAAAKRFQVKGTVGISFCVTETSVANIAVVNPSGSSLLDSAAHDCVVQSAAPFSEGAQGYCFSVPIHFGPQ